MAVKPKIVIAPSAVFPPKWENADAAALQALATGTANDGQQKRALNWILYENAKIYDLEYRPDSREHAFVSGMRNVGLNIMTLLKLDLSKFKE